MASPLLHLVAVDELATSPRGLPGKLARALREDLEYARFGAVLPDLPRFASLSRMAWHRLRQRAQMEPFELLFHAAAPVAVGMKMAELVASGSLVGREPGHAFLAGYFSHIALDRALSPLTELVAARHQRKGESPLAARRRVEWIQALLLIKSRTGRDPAGRPELAARLRIMKRKGLPLWSGAGGGIYEVVRVACLEALGKAPDKRTFDRWVRGLYLFGAVMQSPAGLLARLPQDEAAVRRAFFQDERLDFPAAWEAALGEARTLVARAHAFVARGDFSARARGRFLAEIPEGTLLPSAAPA